MMARRLWLGPQPGHALAAERRGISYLWTGWPQEVSAAEESLAAGEVKLGYLQQDIPAVGNYAGLYAVSSTSRWSWDVALPLARLSGIKLVWNQNGIYYPAWGAAHWRLFNARLGYFMLLASGIIYQSEFCRRAVEQLVPGSAARRDKPSCVLLNPVNPRQFFPAPAAERPKYPVVLTRMMNDRKRRYRNVLAFEAMRQVWRTAPEVRVCFVGAVKGPEVDCLTAMFTEHQRRHRVPDTALGFIPGFTRQEAGSAMRGGTIWLHTGYCDPCPNIVGEAMASGLPVVYLANGGTGELVGGGGIGVPCPEDLHRMRLPAVAAVAEAILTALARSEELGMRARAEALDRLSTARFAEGTKAFLRRLDIL